LVGLVSKLLLYIKGVVLAYPSLSGLDLISLKGDVLVRQDATHIIPGLNEAMDTSAEDAYIDASGAVAA
jgi:hypothetical protein